MSLPPFVLASASPARRRLLQSAGINPIVRASDYDESLVQLPDPRQLVQTLAQRKAETVATQYEWALILGCDSVLVVDGEIHGKPDSPEQAIARWQKMSGNVGDLYTGHALIDLCQHQALVCAQVTRVYFAEVSSQEIEAYVTTDEPLKCAGGFAIEGRGSLFVEKLEGCHTNVIGLSLPLLRQMLNQLDYQVTDFWQ